MIRSLLLGLGTLWLSSSAYAGPILSLDGLPSTFTPGTSFEFDVRLSEAVNLNSYFIELTLEADKGVAGVDFFFESAAQASTDYVFESVDPVDLGGFFAATNTTLSNHQRLSLSDFFWDFAAGVTTVAGQDDRIARVRVGTSSGIRTIRLFFDDTFLELYDANGMSLSDVELTDYTLSADDSRPVVPEPSTLVLSLLGGSTIWLVRRRQRIAREEQLPMH